MSSLRLNRVRFNRRNVFRMLIKLFLLQLWLFLATPSPFADMGIRLARFKFRETGLVLLSLCLLLELGNGSHYGFSTTESAVFCGESHLVMPCMRSLYELQPVDPSGTIT